MAIAAASTQPTDASAEFGLVPIDVLRLRFQRSEFSRLQVLAELPQTQLVSRLSTLAGIKRFFERYCGDPDFRKQFHEAPTDAVADHALQMDALDTESVWRSLTDTAPTAEQTALTEDLELYWDFAREANDWVEFGKQCTRSSDSRYAAWRQRQLARQCFEFAPGVETFFRPSGAFELTKGCSVGCWFCAVSAPRFEDVYAYTDDHARTWRLVQELLKQRIGPAAAAGICYWATDPFDNPDYGRFLDDFFEVHGLFPTTLTALPIKDPQRTRSFLHSTARRGCLSNQFSILSKRILDRVHGEFSAAELLCVSLALQNPGAHVFTAAFPNTTPARKVKAGRVGERSSYPKETVVEEDPGSIACVVGFLFNMVDRSVQLIAPCVASEKWPLGYVIFDRAEFDDADDLASSVDVMMAKHMPLELCPTTVVRFRPGLRYRVDFQGFELATKWRTAVYRDPIRLPGLPDYFTLGALIRRGEMTVAEIMDVFAARHVARDRTSEYLQRLFDAGVLDDEPH